MTPPRLLIVLAALTLPFSRVGAGTPRDSDVVQIDVGETLNARVFAVAKDGAVVPLRDDIDGAGGLATKAASDLLKDKDAHPLPDDATFPATDRHPEAILHYANGDAAQNQARRCVGESTFDFAVPASRYGHLHLFFTSGQGASRIIVKLVYADGSVERRDDLEVPDWYWELKPDDTYRSYLALDLGKWSKDNRMIEDRHHFIFALDVVPSPGKVLSKVYVHKTAPGLMVFYGATGTPAR